MQLNLFPALTALQEINRKGFAAKATQMRADGVPVISGRDLLMVRVGLGFSFGVILALLVTQHFGVLVCVSGFVYALLRYRKYQKHMSVKRELLDARPLTLGL